MAALAQQQLAALNRLITANFSARMPYRAKDELARDQIENAPYGSTP